MSTERRDEEDTYFKQLEIEQRRKLREKLDKAAHELAEKHAIAESLQTADPTVGLALAERIKALGFSGDTAKVFDLLPLVHVAWADGTVQKGERAAILEILKARGVQPGSEGFQLLESLLEERPGDEYMSESLSVLKELVGQGGPDRDVVALCEQVAAAAGGFLGLGGKVSGEERKLIDEIAGHLGGGVDKVKQSLG